MSAPPKLVSEVQKVLGASPTKSVLIVEGLDDFAVYTKWLEKLARPSIYAAKVDIVSAGGSGPGGGKNDVLKALEWFRDRGGNPTRVFGLVDRDEWDAAEITQRMIDLPQLRVNSTRHALESCFSDPEEIMPVLSGHNTTWSASLGPIRAHILQRLPEYVDHWALLTATDRLKNRLAEQGYPGHFANAIPIPADADIQARFHQWAGIIDAAAAFQEFDQLRNTARATSTQVQCRSHVWAKLFFERVVLQAPDGLQSLQNKTVRDWMVDLAEWMPDVPPDVSAMLQPLLT